MQTRFTLKQKFDFGLVVLVILGLTMFAAVRYLGKSAVTFSKERNLRIAMMDIKVDVDAVRYRSPLAQLVSAQTLTTKVDQIDAMLKDGQQEFTAPEQWLFRAGGFGGLFDTIDQSITETVELRQLVSAQLGREVDDKLIERFDNYLALQQKKTDVFMPLMLNAVATIKFAVVALSLFSIFLVAWGGWVSRRSVLGPLAEAINVAEKITGGDLRAEIKTENRDEMGDLMRALNRMTRSIVDIVNEVRAGSAAIADTATQISIGHQDLSARTEHQASTLEQTAASSEELSATVARNAQLAQEANGLARNASSAAETSGESVTKVVTMMNEISASTSRIGDIIGVIDHIAFQTNILALNAAVEAARAGEHGRGFAVVAAEVRSLAQRSATAAKEIRVLIADSLQKVQAGNTLVHDTGEAMRQSVTQTRRTAEIARAIDDASNEQAAGINQVSQAIIQLDNVTQQNATLVEEAHAAVNTLDAQARKLVELVGIFKTGNDTFPAPLQTASSAQRPSVNKGIAETRRASSKVIELSDEWTEF